MTRKEQINLYLKERNIPITSLEANSIIEGIEWADEHPNKKLVYTKQELLDMGIMEDIVDLGKCFETLYKTLDIMIEEYSKMDGFNDIVHKLKRIKGEILHIDIDTL